MSSARKPRQSTRPQGEFADKSRGVRLQRVMADAGVAARRECEELVLSGAVTVNGKVVDRLPAWVDPAEDRIEVYGRPLRKAEQHHYILLFKPRGTVCTNSDPEGRPRAIDLVQHPAKPRLYCVGRLDLDTSGLLILTNDGAFANRLTHPRYLVEKGYDVTVDGSLDERAIAEIERSIFAADRSGKRSETRSSLKLISRDREKTVLHMTLCEHRNLQIRPLMLELGHPVKKLRRTSFGPLRLKGLAVGEWRELTPREVDHLLRSSKSEDRGARLAPREPRRSMAEWAAERVEREQRMATESAAPAPTPAPTPARAGARPARKAASMQRPATKSEGKSAKRAPQGKAPQGKARQGKARQTTTQRSDKPQPKGRPTEAPAPRGARGERSTRDGRPQGRDGRPQGRDGRPQGRDGRPQGRDGRPQGRGPRRGR